MVHIADMNDLAVLLIGKILGEGKTPAVDSHDRSPDFFIGTKDLPVTGGGKTRQHSPSQQAGSGNRVPEETPAGP
jgi:hypothetical protein